LATYVDDPPLKKIKIKTQEILIEDSDNLNLIEYIYSRTIKYYYSDGAFWSAAAGPTFDEYFHTTGYYYVCTLGSYLGSLGSLHCGNSSIYVPNV
jgi:hypothetical protein